MQKLEDPCCPIAIIGMACMYPDARTPGELWENVLAQRRAFRVLPDERLRAADYWSADPKQPDRSYTVQGAVIEGYEFDRVAFRIAGSTFRSADMAHWLALDVASRALVDAGFVDGRGLARETTGVLVGNSLTGEFSRASLMRLRWPYVQGKVARALANEGWDASARQEFLTKLEADYKSPFEAVGEETLAGGLSNTIAGRICNHFDLKGGGYTVDGACASSLLAVANSCSSLAAGDLDTAIAGGVDLSLDPFEIIGFAKTGALAPEDMRVFDRRSAGFWPGEGCGFVVLMRHEDAVAQGCRVYAVIRGWGVSSDGKGGITRPEAAGQIEAIRRANRRAGFGSETVGYCEGHGTGTTVGDATELTVLSEARRGFCGDGPAAVVGSIKANIGHTKAAAGVASLIKATMAVHTQVLPPTTGCEQPVELCSRSGAALRVLREAEIWPEKMPLRASISAMGFGGINAHLLIEGQASERRRRLTPRELSLSSTWQDAELFLFAADSLDQLQRAITSALGWAARISCSEMTDAAARLQSELTAQPFRAAVVASRPAELEERLGSVLEWTRETEPPRARCGEGVFLGNGETQPRIAFLFPGQGSPAYFDAGVWGRRFEPVRKLYAKVRFAEGEAPTSTRVMQPAIVAASLAALRVLELIGVEATAGIGHSLGELTALHWAGVLSEEALLRIAQVRGAAMAALGSPAGAMAALTAPADEVQSLIEATCTQVWAVGLNSPRQTVVAGEEEAVRLLMERAATRGWSSTRLPVSHAFHTPLVAAATPILAEQLAQEDFARPAGRVISTVTGKELCESEELRELLCRQVSSPVRFSAALQTLLDGKTSTIDLFVEVGPGSVLTGLARDFTRVPVISMDVCHRSIRGLLDVAGAAYALGASLNHSALFANRFVRPFNLDWKPKFFANPCALAAEPFADKGVVAEASTALLSASDAGNSEEQASTSGANGSGHRLIQPPPNGSKGCPLELLKNLVTQRAELPASAVQDDHRMLSDLHLNSISVGQIVSEAARHLGLPGVAALTEFANATVREIADALNNLVTTGVARPGSTKTVRNPDGAGVWVEAFGIEFVETRLATAGANGTINGLEAGTWQVFSAPGHPLAAPLTSALKDTLHNGVAVCVAPEPGAEDVSLMLNAARAVLELKNAPIFLLIQHGRGGGGFARTLHLETPGLTTCVLNVPIDAPNAIKWIVEELRCASGFCEAHYDGRGRRFEPRLTYNKVASKSEGRRPVKLGSKDVLVVTGGGKGIAAECALALARQTGSALALLGRSDPASDHVLAENLSRIKAAGVRSCYVQADVTDPAAVRAAVARVRRKFGMVTAILHGAGINKPQMVASLSGEEFRQTLAPKLEGLHNLLASVEQEELRLLVTFSSIIARTGLPGEAHYATANEWLTHATEIFQKNHPKCLCLALEWSVWSGLGMGDRLGQLQSLASQGIMAIPTDAGVAKFVELLLQPPRRVAAVVCGRFGEPPTLKMKEPELPLRRFLERKRVYYPGVELVVDAEISAETDPYLNDHMVQRERLLPAVLGLEAMAQAAMAVAETEVLPDFENVLLSRPVAVPATRPLTIRLAALRRGPDTVEVCLRSEETDFQVDHFRALCRFDQQKNNGRATETVSSQRGGLLAEAENNDSEKLLHLDPTQDLYGRILFHQGRFCRVSGYRTLKARECFVEITPESDVKWFGAYLPETLVLGDPGSRDAALHAIQACIPHQRILPAAIAKITIFETRPGPRFARAVETSQEGQTFTYDLEMLNEREKVVERWTGLKLRAIEQIPMGPSLAPALATPWLERRLQELLPQRGFTVALRENGGDALTRFSNKDSGRSETTFLLSPARGFHKPKAFRGGMGSEQSVRVWRRPDGKPVTCTKQQVSASHQETLTLAISGDGPVACDLERVTARTDEVWRGLLGESMCSLASRISRDRAEGMNASSTRLWTVLECLKKAGLPADAPLVIESASDDGWVVLRSGTLGIAGCLLAFASEGGQFAVTFALGDSVCEPEPAGL